jgi:hypothetical protein
MPPSIGRLSLLKPATRRNIDLAADDRFYTRLCRAPVKFHSTKEIAMIRYRYCGHPEGNSLIDKFFYPYRSVQQAVFGMQMEGNIV